MSFRAQALCHVIGAWVKIHKILTQKQPKQPLRRLLKRCQWENFIRNRFQVVDRVQLKRFSEHVHFEIAQLGTRMGVLITFLECACSFFPVSISTNKQSGAGWEQRPVFVLVLEMVFIDFIIGRQTVVDVVKYVEVSFWPEKNKVIQFL